MSLALQLPFSLSVGPLAPYKSCASHPCIARACTDCDPTIWYSILFYFTALNDASYVMLRDASMDRIFCDFHRPCARHCHLKRSVHLAFRRFHVDRALTESGAFTAPLKVVEASRWILLIVAHDIHSRFVGSGDFLGVAFTTPLKVVDALRLGSTFLSTTMFTHFLGSDEFPGVCSFFFTS